MDFVRGGALGAVLARLTSAALVFLVAVIWARALGPEDFGSYSLAYTVLLTVAALSTLGLDQLASRELAVALHRRDWPRVWGFMRWSWLLSMALSIGSVVVASVLVIWNPMDWENGNRVAVLWMIVAIPGLVTLRLIRGAFQANDRTSVGLFWELIAWNAFVALGGLAAMWGFLPASSRAASQVYVGAAVLAAVLASFALLRIRWPRSTSQEGTYRAWFRSGLGFAGLAVVGLLVHQADILILSMVGTRAEIGLYSIANRSALLVLILLAPIQQVIGPRIAKAWSDEDLSNVALFARRAARLGIVAGLALLGFFLAFGSFFLAIFGTEFSHAAPTLRILAAAQMGLLVLGPGPMVLIMTGAERVAALVQALSLIGGLGLGVALYHGFGIEGLAAGRVLTLAAIGLVSTVLAVRRTGRRIDPWVR